MREKKSPNRTKKSHDDDDIEIIAETIDDFMIVPNDDFSESGSDIADGEISCAKSPRSSKNAAAEEHAKTSAESDKSGKTERMDVEINKHEPSREKKKDIQKQLNIQLLKEYGKKLYGRGAQRKPVTNSEEDKNKWKGFKMMLDEGSNSEHKEHSTNQPNEQKQRERSKISPLREKITRQEPAETEVQNANVAAELTELIGDIVKELSAETQGNERNGAGEDNANYSISEKEIKDPAVEDNLSQGSTQKQFEDPKPTTFS